MHNVKSWVDSLDVSTRGKRRKAVSIVISMLEKIHGAEFDYMERVPMNLQAGDAYAAADYCVDILADSIVLLLDAY